MRALKLPPDPGELSGLEAGDEVCLSGPTMTLRDAALNRLDALVCSGAAPPFDLEGQLVFHAGPTPPAAGRPCGAIGPTTSARMDHFLPLLFSLGVRSTLGKGPRSGEAADLHRAHGAVYLAAVGGAGALYGGMIEAIETVAWDDLGPEAVFRVVLKDLPTLVAIDARGVDFFAKQYVKYAR
jgi:tartrate/fumarate subfamily iron-sulfur-dependent hydro-lyase beta chain